MTEPYSEKALEDLFQTLNDINMKIFHTSDEVNRYFREKVEKLLDLLDYGIKRNIIPESLRNKKGVFLFTFEGDDEVKGYTKYLYLNKNTLVFLVKNHSRWIRNYQYEYRCCSLSTVRNMQLHYPAILKLVKEVNDLLTTSLKEEIAQKEQCLKVLSSINIENK